MLGEARERSEAPERQMTPAQSCILRLLTHLALLQGAYMDRSVGEPLSAQHQRPLLASVQNEHFL